MAYWWVSQNKTYQHERDGQYLWAPKRDKGGNPQHHWTSMTEVEPGDVVFSAVRQKIVAVSVARTSAQDAVRPSGFNDGLWEQDGWMVNLDFQELEFPVAIESVVSDLQPLLPSTKSPLTKGGTGVQGYLFHVPPEAGSFLLSQIDEVAAAHLVDTSGQKINAGIKKLDIPETEKVALTKSRKGQGPFRDNLMIYWDNKCAVSDFSIKTLLRASHIKPWSDSNNIERLDVHNGLLLGPAYDAAFDKGYISFADDGELLVSAGLDDANLSRLGIEKNARLRAVEPGHKPYLTFHRDHVFKSG